MIAKRNVEFAIYAVFIVAMLCAPLLVGDFWLNRIAKYLVYGMVGIAMAIGAVALVWGLGLSKRVPSFDTYTHMFDEWEMKSETVEVARETCGLLIVAVWMAAVALHSWSGPR